MVNKKKPTLKEKWKANSPKRNKTLTNICVGISKIDPAVRVVLKG